MWNRGANRGADWILGAEGADDGLVAEEAEPHYVNVAVWLEARPRVVYPGKGLILDGMSPESTQLFSWMSLDFAWTGRAQVEPSRKVIKKLFN